MQIQMEIVHRSMNTVRSFVLFHLEDENENGIGINLDFRGQDQVNIRIPISWVRLFHYIEE